MLYRLFSIYDVKAQVYLVPFTEKTIGSAIRLFAHSCQNPDTLFYKHPEDFTLFHLGDFDDNNCGFALLEAPVPIAKAIEHVGGHNANEG